MKNKASLKACGSASGIPVYCAHTKVVDIESVIPNPRNPNRHPEQQIALLSKIIKTQGWRNSIVVSSLSGMVVKGHARLASARSLGLKEVPVDVQPYATEADEWADMIADNRIAELAAMEMPILKDMLVELDNGAFDMTMTGYDEASLAALLTEIPSAPTPPVTSGDLNIAGRFILVFSNDDEKQVWISRLGVAGDKVVYTIDDLAPKQE